MALPRLPFLWPMLFKTTELVATEPITRRRASHLAVRTTQSAHRATSDRASRRAIHVTARRRQETVQQRYGSANEPPPHLGGEQRNPVKTDLSKGAASSTARAEDTKQADTQKAKKAVGDPALNATEDTPVQDTPPSLKTTAEKPKESLLDTVSNPATTEDKAKDTSSTSLITYEEHQPPMHAPHMEAPRHVHHFDTYGLVKRLEDAGWKNEQAITLMKSVRLMLADNMDLAREALVSKSQVENETYLFKAACSELKTEVSTRRKGDQDKMRTQRTQLAHELDILNQRLGQESANMKDDLKGMFDDRKMTVRNEQREMESKIQELNYKITVSLQADSKSDVEALRWIMTRRVILTLGLIVMMVLSSLKLYSNALHDKELERKRRARMKDAYTQVESVSTGTGTDPMVASEMLVKEGDNPAYVSLG